MKYQVNVTFTIEKSIDVEIPDGLTEDQANELIEDALEELGHDANECDWEYDGHRPKFKPDPKLDPLHPIWMDTAHGKWAITGMLLIRHGFELPKDFVMPSHWRDDVPVKNVNYMLSSMPTSDDLMLPHKGWFLPWVYPLMDMGLKAIGDSPKSPAWLFRGDECVALVMPVDRVYGTPGEDARQWPN